MKKEILVFFITDPLPPQLAAASAAVLYSGGFMF